MADLVACEVRSLQEPAFGADHMLPSAARKKAVILARNKLGSILQRYLERRLDARPLVEHSSWAKPSVGSVPHGPVDRVSDVDIGQPATATVGH